MDINTLVVVTIGNRKIMNQMVFLSGLPRTGSTLLSAILSQNPKIHSEVNSAVCQLMWDLQTSCFTTANQQLAATNRYQTIHDLVSQVPSIYYKNSSESIIVDKCRSWTIPQNIELIQKYISKDFKMIVLERPILEIIQSFAKLHHENHKVFEWEKYLIPGSEPIMRSIMGLNHVKKLAVTEGEHFLFVSYNDIVNHTEETIRKIYDFCGWDYFAHDFQHVSIKYPENDEVYDLKGHHTIRSVVKRVENKMVIPESIKAKCLMIDKLMGYTS